MSNPRHIQRHIIIPRRGFNHLTPTSSYYNSFQTNDRVMLSPRYNVFIYEGSDHPWVTDSGRSQNNLFRRNTLVGGLESIKITSADRARLNGNTFQDAIKIRFENSTGTVMLNNSGLDTVDLRVTEGACFHRASDAAFVPVC